jgi:hypothetical protein
VAPSTVNARRRGVTGVPCYVFAERQRNNSRERITM